MGLAVALLVLGACGDNLEGIPDVILPAAIYAARCAQPRSGTDPVTRVPYPDRDGSELTEKLWVRSWIDDVYLWYSEVPAVDMTQFDTTVGYFDVMKTSAVTASGRAKDRFHFAYATADWEAMSQASVNTAEYGLRWVLSEVFPPHPLAVGYVEPGSPAANAGIDHGTQFIAIDGIDVTVDVKGADIDRVNAAMFPTTLGETHSFVVIDRGKTTPRTVSLTTANVALTPVKIADVLPAPNDKVGYLLFTDHIALAEKQLFDAINHLSDAGVTDLILDLRYNGGGFLDIASELAYMIAGPAVTQGKIFLRQSFNDKHPTVNPSTGDVLMPLRFASQAEGFSLDEGTSLPNLGLSRVFVLTSVSTCSASEALMNGLAGAGVEVIQIGTKTCGKPYGFYPTDNCGTTFFAIEFQSVNDRGFADFADGFVPGDLLTGCVVADDFSHALGDPAEARVATALAYRADRHCPAVPAQAAGIVEGTVSKPLWLQNQILRR